VLTQYAGIVGFGLDRVAGSWASDPLGLSTLGKTYVGSWISPLLQLGLVLDMMAVAIGFTSASTRGVAALARSGLLPAALTRTTRWRTPSIGITVYAVATMLCVIGIVILCTATGIDPFMGFMIGATFGGLLVTMAYLMLTVAAGKLLITGQCAAPGWGAFVLAIVTVGAAIVGSIYPLPTDATRYGVYGAAVLLLVSLAWGCYHGIVCKHTLAEPASLPAANS
jgi:amino acid transporter